MLIYTQYPQPLDFSAEVDWYNIYSSPHWDCACGVKAIPCGAEHECWATRLAINLSKLQDEIGDLGVPDPNRHPGYRQISKRELFRWAQSHQQVELAYLLALWLCANKDEIK